MRHAGKVASEPEPEPEPGLNLNLSLSLKVTMGGASTTNALIRLRKYATDSHGYQGEWVKIRAGHIQVTTNG